jgi:hypothetical protein
MTDMHGPADPSIVANFLEQGVGTSDLSIDTKKYMCKSRETIPLRVFANNF